MDEIGRSLLEFLHLTEGLKNELRNGRTSQGKRESVAEHTWRVTLMILVFSKYFDREISLERALKMAVVHDLAEMITGDRPYFLFEGNPENQQNKIEQELRAMEYIRNLLPEPIGAELVALWEEYESGESYESKIVKAIDKIEAQIQHNEMEYRFWNDFDRKFAANRLDKYCSFDSFLTKIKNLVQMESIEKIKTESN